ncbi:MAG: M42 family metallopeptidase [Planctomycetota bacterium]|jgi:putative aminopeptidase FrvX
MDNLLEELVRAPGVPGYEDRVRALIESRLPAGVPVATDTMGNLVATLGAGERALMFVAHMDEIGFIVSEVRDDGYLKLQALGGIDPRTVFGRALRIVTESGELPGVVAVKPPHLMRERAQEMSEVPPVGDLLVDIGAASRAEAEELGVKVLDFAVPERSVRILNEKLICARALDDRMGCYILLRALERLREETFGWKVHFAFSVQEEVGLRGATLLANRYALDLAFAVDSCSTADFPGVSADLSSARLGEGTCLRVLDRAAVIPPAFRKELSELAAGEGIALQVVFSGGGTDVRPFQTQGPQVMALAFPMRYTHSAVELVHRDDVEETVRFVCAIARHYAGGR